jgi:hypothetical protein
LGYDIFGNIYDLNVITGIDKFVGSKTPSEFSLSQNYPNPFNPTTIINYEIPEQFEGAVTLGGSEKSVTLKVFDVLGREVNTLVNKPRSAGKYSVSFDASNLSSGIYYYQLTLGEFIKTKKMVLLK